MMQEEASALGIHLRALVEAPDGSTAQVTVDAPVGLADDAAAVRRVVTGQARPSQDAASLQAAAPADVLTFEHEHQDADLLRQLEDEGVSVQPTPAALELARDKLAMRRAMAQAGLPQPRWSEAAGSQEEMRAQILAFGEVTGWPLVIKTPRGGYDGHGVLLVHSPAELDQGEASQWIAQTAAAREGRRSAQTGGGGSLGGAAVTSLLLEEAVAFTRELAVLLARSPSGEVACWPVVQSVQADGVCSEVLAPAPGLDEAAVREAERIGRAVATGFGVTGVLAVELFAVEEPGQPTALYVNELAMRPHNSGHWTQDGAVTSQFAQHLRAVADLPLGSGAGPCRGPRRSRSPGPPSWSTTSVASTSRALAPWHARSRSTRRPVSTSTASSGAQGASSGTSTSPCQGIRPSRSRLRRPRPCASAPAPSSPSYAVMPEPSRQPLTTNGRRKLMSATTQPVVGIVMGSDSDWPTMEAAAQALDELGISYEADVVSAHRMPTEMIDYGRTASSRGLRVIVAGAGGAAHLPGMLAAVTELPVIGVPVPLKHLDGMDSLLSIVQMPAGVPVATVSIGGARNAGLLAARVLGAGEGPEAERIRSAMRDFQAELAQVAHAKGARLRQRRAQA